MNKVIGQCKPSDFIHHSDQCARYMSVAFGLGCKEEHALTARPTMLSRPSSIASASQKSLRAALPVQAYQGKGTAVTHQ